MLTAPSGDRFVPLVGLRVAGFLVGPQRELSYRAAEVGENLRDISLSNDEGLS
jgi:hypothetical protein